MKIENKIIFLVDDDTVFLKLMEIEFKQNTTFEILTFSTGEECIQKLHLNPFLVVLDYQLDGIVENAINGINTLDLIKSINADIPVVMLSSQDKIEVAIDCMHHKALDYITKSETSFIRLLTIISAYEKYQTIEKNLKWYMKHI
jgi:two-component system OmpR family response regulator